MPPKSEVRARRAVSYRTGTSPSPRSPSSALSDLGAGSMISSAQLMTCPGIGSAWARLNPSWRVRGPAPW